MKIFLMLKKTIGAVQVLCVICYMTLHTKAELLDLFKEYESISLEEVKIVVPLRGTDRYFEVLAKKRKNRI